VRDDAASLNTNPILFNNPAMNSLLRSLALSLSLGLVGTAHLAAGAERPSVNRDVGDNLATPPGRIKAAKDFKVELLYSVPGRSQGSWVNLCVDAKQ